MSNQLKAIFWNIWGHRHPEQINEFLDEHRDADFICLTEVTHMESLGLPFRDTNLCYSENPNEAPSQVNGYDQLQLHLNRSHSLRYDSATYAPWACQERNILFNRVGFGSALCAKNACEMYAEVIAFNYYPNLKPRVLQWCIHEKDDVRYLVAHIHGVWIKGNTKGDHDARIFQSLEIRRHLQSVAEEFQIDKIIFGGDLNLDAHTQALRLLELGVAPMDVHYRNLIREYDVTNTRTNAYRSIGLPGHTMYADYVLVSDPVVIHSFEVLNHITASDHAPIVVTFS